MEIVNCCRLLLCSQSSPSPFSFPLTFSKGGKEKDLHGKFFVVSAHSFPHKYFFGGGVKFSLSLLDQGAAEDSAHVRVPIDARPQVRLQIGASTSPPSAQLLLELRTLVETIPFLTCGK